MTLSFDILLDNAKTHGYEPLDTLWDQGFRPYEIYVYNQTPTEYYGETVGAGTVAGWDIKHVFSTRELLKSYPYFDAVIGLSDMSVCEEIWKG